MSAPYLRQTAEGVVISVQAQPNAKRNAIAGLHGERLKIRLRAPPVEGKANECLIEFLSEVLGALQSAIEIIRGQTARSKDVLVRGKSLDEVSERLSLQQSG